MEITLKDHHDLLTLFHQYAEHKGVDLVITEEPEFTVDGNVVGVKGRKAPIDKGLVTPYEIVCTAIDKIVESESNCHTIYLYQVNQTHRDLDNHIVVRYHVEGDENEATE